ncbi:MAG: hypothetical protein NTV34_21725 [Proteobacteria bacterium]|nr:hypothetical protein [Pseudomonadota bacterium]
MNHLNSQIEQLWIARSCGNIVAARDIFFDITRDLKIPHQDTLTNQFDAFSDDIKPIAIDYLCFPASELRFRRQTSQSLEHLSSIKKLASTWSSNHYFQVEFQLGLTFLVSSNYVEALNCFAMAIRLGRTHYERIAASLNEILCLESLGYPFSSKLEQFDALMSADMDGVPPQLKAQILDQYRALKLRLAFAGGDQDDLEHIARQAMNEGSLWQARYLTLFYGALPHYERLISMATSQPPQGELLQHDFFMNSYRLGTLQEVMSRSELKSPQRLCEQIERFYLWTWWWLLSPTHLRTERLLILWETICKTLGDSDLAQDEYALLRNAGRWLFLFAGLDDSLIDKYLSLRGGSQKRAMPLFDYENLLLNFLFAYRDSDPIHRDDGLKLLENHPVNKLESTALGYLARRLSHKETVPSNFYEEQFEPLVNALASLGVNLDSRPRHDAVIIHYSQRRIFLANVDGLQSVIENHRILTLVSLSLGRSMVPLIEVLKAVFGSHTYDPVTHDPRLSQLLVTANKLLGSYISFQRRRDLIHVKRKSGLQTGIEGGGVHSSLLFESFERIYRSIGQARPDEVKASEWNRSGESAEPQQGKSPPLGAKQRLKHNVWYKRTDLESIFTTSRATIHRRMVEWVQQGHFEKAGVGKSSRYRLKSSRASQFFQYLEEAHREHAH